MYTNTFTLTVSRTDCQRAVSAGVARNATRPQSLSGSRGPRSVGDHRAIALRKSIAEPIKTRSNSLMDLSILISKTWY